MEKEIIQGSRYYTPDQRRSGRPKTNWHDNIMEWTGLKGHCMLRSAEDRRQWWNIVHVAVNPRIKVDWTTTTSYWPGRVTRSKISRSGQKFRPGSIFGLLYNKSNSGVSACRLYAITTSDGRRTRRNKMTVVLRLIPEDSRTTWADTPSSVDCIRRRPHY